MPAQDFPTLYARLRAILAAYAANLTVTQDVPGHYALDAPRGLPGKGPTFFAAVQLRKRYISYHLMPVYVHPKLLASISPALRRRMHGKSCFNFTALDETLLVELEGLTARGYAAFVSDGLI